MIENLQALLSAVFNFQVVTPTTALQMDMPMPMHTSDAWAWIIVLAAIVILAVTVPAVLLTRPSRRTTPNTPVAASDAAIHYPLTTQTPQQPSNAKETEDPAKRTNQLKKALNLVRPTLTDDERRILNEVVKAGGEIKQSDLPNRSSFSKAHVSKLIKSLETMGIITRQKYRWTYWVRFSEKLVPESKNA